MFWTYYRQYGNYQLLTSVLPTNRSDPMSDEMLQPVETLWEIIDMIRLGHCVGFLHVALAVGIKHMRVPILLKQVQHRVESSRQLEIAFRSRQWDHPQEVNGLTAQVQF